MNERLTFLIINLLVLLSIQIKAYSQIELSGLITNDKTGAPVPSAHVIFYKTNIGTITNADGFYKVWTNQQVDSLQVTADGYSEKFISLDTLTSHVVNVSLKEKIVNKKNRLRRREHNTKPDNN
jgi:hypothetical protein